MERGEELKSVQEVIKQPHLFVRMCINERCEKFGEEYDVHGDDNRGSHCVQMTRIFAPSTNSILDRMTYCSKHHECEACQCQTKETGCFATEPKDLDYWEEYDAQPNGPMVVTPTSKSSPGYYKRWKTKEGGSPDFNPVSNTGGRGTREGAMEAVNGTKADKMELDMTAAKRKVKKVKTGK